MYRQSWRNLLINAKLPRLNHGTFPITCSFTLSSKNLLWFVIDSKTELIKIAIFQIKLNSPSNSQPSTMQWHDMIVLKTLFLKELVSKSAILNEVIDFEIKQFWNQTFFRHWAVRSWASQTDPEFWPSHKKVHNKTPLYSTRVSTVARTMPDLWIFCPEIVWV